MFGSAIIRWMKNCNAVTQPLFHKDKDNEKDKDKDKCLDPLLFVG